MSKQLPPESRPTRRELQEKGLCEGRPWWVTSTPGFPLKPILPEDAEKLALAAIADARQFVESPIAAYASDSQRFLADAERRRITTEAQLTLAPSFLAQGNLDGWYEQIVHQVRALRDLGQFDEARAVIIGAAFAHDLDDLLADVNEIDAACQRPEDYDCGCEREVTTIEVESVGKRVQEQEIALHRRFLKREFTFCPYRAKVMPLYECRHCGQRSVGVPPRQADYEIQRQAHHAAVLAAYPDGRIPKGTVIAASKADHHLLKS